jgi:large subunit ribosomal protein L35
MPKIKSNRGAAKRFKKTGSGKFKRQHSNYSHIRTKKDRDRKRNLRKPDTVHHSDEKHIRRLLPYA